MSKGQVNLELVHAFGSLSSTGMKNSICFGDDESATMIYAVGKHIGVRSMDTTEMSFIMVRIT